MNKSADKLDFALEKVKQLGAKYKEFFIRLVFYEDCSGNIEAGLSQNETILFAFNGYDDLITKIDEYIKRR